VAVLPNGLPNGRHLAAPPKGRQLASRSPSQWEAAAQLIWWGAVSGPHQIPNQRIERAEKKEEHARALPAARRSLSMIASTAAPHTAQRQQV
jgi:hypothetical protein